MRMRILGALAILLAEAAWATAEPGVFGTCSVFDKLKHHRCAACTATSESCGIPTHPMPAPSLFRAEVACPTYVEGKALPSVQLFRAVPPPVEIVAGRPPEIQLFRAPPPGVELMAATTPSIEFFRRQPQPLGQAPPIKVPSVALFYAQQPCQPCCPPPVCAPPCNNNCEH